MRIRLWNSPSSIAPFNVLASNGGEPDPYVFENDELDTVVSKFLPLSK